MAITETRPADVPTEVPAEAERFVGLTDHDPGGFAGLVGTGDHKVLGRAWIIASLAFGLTALVLVALFHAHVAASFLPDDTVDQVATLGVVALVLLFAIPLFVGLATYVCPLQVGANTIAFPRAAAMAFWGWLLGSSILIGAYIANGGPGGGRAKAVDLSFIALTLILASLCTAAVCLGTTVFALRTSGLWMTRIPLFSWSVVVAVSLWLFTLPVLVGNLLLVYLDHHYGSGSAFGGSEWSYLSWAFAQPAIYVVAIPALGAISDILATFGGARQRHRGVVMAAIGAFGILSFGAYAQPALVPGVESQALYVAMAVLAVLPVLVLLGAWTVTLRAGKPVLKSPLLFAMASGLVLLLAVVAGGVYAIKPLELHNDTWTSNSLGIPPYSTGHGLLVVGAALLAGLGAVVYWSPKLFGRFANDGLAKLAALLGLAGALIAGLPLMIYGFALKVDSLGDAQYFLNGLSAAGVVILILAVAAVVVALIVGSRGDEDELADDAWGVGQTLEWATASPPAAINFDAPLPRVASPEPVLDLAEAEVAS